MSQAPDEVVERVASRLRPIALDFDEYEVARQILDESGAVFLTNEERHCLGSKREQLIAEIAPIIEEMESRYPETVIAGRVVDAIKPILDEHSATECAALQQAAEAVLDGYAHFRGMGGPERLHEAIERLRQEIEQ